MKPASEAAKDRQKIKNAYWQVFNSLDGRAVLADLEREAGEGKDIFSPNANKTMYAVGKRALLVYIKTMTKDE